MTAVEIFSGPNCSYCARAKALLEEKGIAYTDRDIAADQANRDELVRRLPRAKVIPQIFIDGDHIGGYEDLCLLDERGRLDQLVAEAG